MLKVLPPDPEIGWMDSKTVKLNCWKWAYFQKKWSVPLKKFENHCFQYQLLHLTLHFKHLSLNLSCLSRVFHSVFLLHSFVRSVLPPLSFSVLTVMMSYVQSGWRWETHQSVSSDTLYIWFVFTRPEFGRPVDGLKDSYSNCFHARETSTCSHYHPKRPVDLHAT